MNDSIRQLHNDTYTCEWFTDGCLLARICGANGGDVNVGQVHWRCQETWPKALIFNRSQGSFISSSGFKSCVKALANPQNLCLTGVAGLERMA